MAGGVGDELKRLLGAILTKIGPHQPGAPRPPRGGTPAAAVPALLGQILKALQGQTATGAPAGRYARDAAGRFLPRTPQTRANAAAGAVNQHLAKMGARAGARTGQFERLANHPALEKLGLAGVAKKGVQYAKAAAGDPTAIAATAGDLLKMVGNKLRTVREESGKAFGSAGKALNNERAGDVLAGGFGAGEHALKAVGGPFGTVGAQVFKFGKIMGESLEKLRRWTDQLHEANLRFAEFSPSMAGVAARDEARQIMLDQQRGERRAPSAENLAQGKNKLDKTLAVFEDGLASFKNNIGGSFSKALANSPPLLVLKGMGITMQWMADHWPGAKDEEGLSAGAAWFNDIGAQSAAEERAGRPHNFPGVP